MRKNFRNGFARLFAVILGLGLGPTLAAAEGVGFATAEHPASSPEKLPLPAAEIAQSAPLAVLAPAEVAAPEELLALEGWNLAKRQPTRNGFSRPLFEPVAVVLSPGIDRARVPGVVDESGADPVWAGRFEVEGAYRLRLGLTGVELPAGSEMWVRGESGPARRFGSEMVDEEGRLWTPSTEGGVVHLQVRWPAGEAAPAFAVEEVMELFALGPRGVPMLDDELRRRGTECLQDAACYGESSLAGLGLYKQAVAHLQYVKNGSSFICSGALMNDTDTSGFIPYLLTANHCFSTQSSASSLEAYFDYIAVSCLGSWPNLASLPRVSGSTLLATTDSTDSTFVRLSGNPSGNNTYLGWTTASATSGTTLYRLAHPQGWPQSFSIASAHNPPGVCSSLPTSDFVYGSHTLGGTAGGSSGAPTVDANLRVRGQLYGKCGSMLEDPCSPLNSVVDGRFSNFFSLIRQYLDPQDGCTPSGTNLCLTNGRFKVEGTWRDFSGNQGDFNAEPYTTDSGLFWFFDPNNVEFLVKVLDACGVNDHFWVFAAATTNVEYTLRVTDTATNTIKSYFNPLGNAAPALTDTSAFATCP